MRYALILSVLINVILLWKVGSNSTSDFAVQRSGHFTPDSVANVNRVNPSQQNSHLLSHVNSSEKSKLSSRESNDATMPNAQEESSPKGADEEIFAKWDERVSGLISNVELERYRAMKYMYQKEISEYVLAKSTPGAEYFVPTLEDQREMLRIKDRYSKQIRETLGEENYTHYQRMLREFNAAQMKNSSDGRAPASEAAFIEI